MKQQHWHLLCEFLDGRDLDALNYTLPRLAYLNVVADVQQDACLFRACTILQQNLWSFKEHTIVEMMECEFCTRSLCATEQVYLLSMS